MKRYFLVLIIALGFGIANGQEVETPGLITDRPDQTESAAVVPKKHFQIETGFVYQQKKTDAMTEGEFGVLTTLFRYGINEYFEVQMGSAFLQNKQEPSGGESTTVSGMAPLFLGMKFKMLKENGGVPEMAFLFTTEFPGTGKKEFSPTYNTSDLRFAIEYTLTDRLGFGMNLGAGWNGETAKPGGVYTLVFGYSATEKISVFLESYGFLPQDEHPDHRLDTGLTFLLKPNLQLDASAGIGLSDISPDFFVSTGLSWRIPN